MLRPLRCLLALEVTHIARKGYDRAQQGPVAFADTFRLAVR